jgi:hypothetical protein
MFNVYINYLAVALAAVSSMIIGSIWYSPFLFAKPWMSLTGINMEGAKAKRNTSYVLMFVSALVLAYVLAHFVAYFNVATIGQALQLGFWAWLGFCVTTKLSDYLFANRPMKLFGIDVGFHFFEFMAMAIILTLMS